MADQKLTASDLSSQYRKKREAYTSSTDDVQTSEQTPSALSSQYKEKTDRIRNKPYEQALRESPEFALTEVDSTKRLWNPEDRTDKEVFEDDLASALGPGEWTTADPEQLQNIIEKKFGDKYIYISRDITPEEKENTPTRFYGTNWLHADKEFGIYDPKSKTMFSLNKHGASWADLRAGVTSEIPYILASPFTFGAGWAVRGLTAGASMMGTNAAQQVGRIGLGGATNYDPIETGLIGAGTVAPYLFTGARDELATVSTPITDGVSKFFTNTKNNIRSLLGLDGDDASTMGYGDFRRKVHKANADINKPYERVDGIPLENVIPLELAERGYTGGASARQSSDVQTRLAQSQEILRGSGSSDRVEDQVARDYEDWLNARNVSAKDLLTREMLSPIQNKEVFNRLSDKVDNIFKQLDELDKGRNSNPNYVTEREELLTKLRNAEKDATNEEIRFAENTLGNANNALNELNEMGEASPLYTNYVKDKEDNISLADYSLMVKQIIQKNKTKIEELTNILNRIENPADIPPTSDLHDRFLRNLNEKRSDIHESSSEFYDKAKETGQKIPMTPDVIKLFYPDKIINELSDTPVINKALKRFKELIDPDNLIGTRDVETIKRVPSQTPVKFNPLPENTTRQLLNFAKDGRKVKIGDKVTIDGVEYTYNYKSDSSNPYFRSRGFSYYFTHGDEVVRISDHWSKTVGNNRSKKFNAGGLTEDGYQWQIDEKAPIVQFKVSGEKYDSRFIGASAPIDKLKATGVKHWGKIPTKKVQNQRVRTLDETDIARRELRDTIYNLKTGSGGVKQDFKAGDQLQRVLDNYEDQLANLKNISFEDEVGQEWLTNQVDLDSAVIKAKKDLDEAIANKEDFETVGFYRDEYDEARETAKTKAVDKLKNIKQFGDYITVARGSYSDMMNTFGKDKTLGKVTDGIRKGELDPKRIMGALLSTRGVPKFGDEVVKAIKFAGVDKEMKDIIRFSLFTLPNDIDTPQLGMRLGSSLRTQWDAMKDTAAVKKLFTEDEQKELAEFVKVYSQLDIARMEQRVNSATANRLLSNRAIRSPGMGVIHRLFNYVLDAGAKGEEIARRRLTMQKIIVEANEKLDKPITLIPMSKIPGILGAYVGKTLSDTNVLEDDQTTVKDTE